MRYRLSTKQLDLYKRTGIAKAFSESPTTRIPRAGGFFDLNKLREKATSPPQYAWIGRFTNEDGVRTWSPSIIITSGRFPPDQIPKSALEINAEATITVLWSRKTEQPFPIRSEFELHLE